MPTGLDLPPSWQVFPPIRTVCFRRAKLGALTMRCRRCHAVLWKEYGQASRFLCHAFFAMLSCSVVVSSLRAEQVEANRAASASQLPAERIVSISRIVIGLRAAVSQLSSYPLETSFPRVTQVSHERLAAQACDGRCAMVKAAYVPDDGIYLTIGSIPSIARWIDQFCCTS